MAQETSLISIVPDSSQEGTTIKVNEKTKQVTYSAEEPVSQRLIAQVGFNKKSGVLNFVRKNTEILPITGFLTASQFGQGIRGPKGKQGKPGKDGRLGRDGKEGKVGCEGLVGAKGITGTKGLDGEDGETGITGYAGCPGAPGAMGSQGIIGLPGHQGPQGNQGASCIVGPQGEQGPQPKEVVYYGQDFPADDYFLWAIPYTEGQVTEPVPVAADMSGQVDDASASMTLVVDNTYGGTLVLRLKNFVGGTTPYTYKWTDVDSVFADPSITVGNTGTTSSSLELKALQNINQGNTATISGKVNLEVRDSKGKFLNIDNISFTFTGQNNQTTSTGSGGGVVVGGGGGGCIMVDTPIYLIDGTVLKAGDVMIGDTIFGYNMPNMIDESQEGWEKWTTKDTTGNVEKVVVRNALNSWFTGYWLINNDLGITIDHEMFVKKGDTWGWHCADNIELGDSLLDINNEPVLIETLEYVDKKIPVIILDVENVDTYFAGHSKVLVHNVQSSRVVKN